MATARSPESALTAVPEEEPCYVISIAARLLGVHAQTLRYYERVGLIRPTRSAGNIRLYSARDLRRVRELKQLMDELGVNLAGAEFILALRERIRKLERELDDLRTQLDHPAGDHLPGRDRPR